MSEYSFLSFLSDIFIPFLTITVSCTTILWWKKNNPKIDINTTVIKTPEKTDGLTLEVLISNYSNSPISVIDIKLFDLYIANTDHYFYQSSTKKLPVTISSFGFFKDTITFKTSTNFNAIKNNYLKKITRFYKKPKFKWFVLITSTAGHHSFKNISLHAQE